MSSSGTSQRTANSVSKGDENSSKNGKKDNVNRNKKSEWVTIEILVPFDFDLTRKIKIRREFGHLISCWQIETGSNVRLPLVIHTCDGPKFVRETNTPNDLINVDYGEMVVFDLGPPDCYFDDPEETDSDD